MAVADQASQRLPRLDCAADAQDKHAPRGGGTLGTEDAKSSGVRPRPVIPEEAGILLLRCRTY